jgi:hypothetical protein
MATMLRALRALRALALLLAPPLALLLAPPLALLVLTTPLVLSVPRKSRFGEIRPVCGPIVLRVLAKFRFFSTSQIAWLDRKAYGRPILAVYADVGEGRSTHDLDAHGREEASRNGDGLYRLVDGTGTDALHLNRNAILYHAGDGPGH